MDVADFDYELPPELVAQEPPPIRGGARMLVMARDSGDCELTRFSAFPSFLREGDCLVLNDTRVLYARLYGRRVPSGGRVEALLLEAVSGTRWRCLLRPGRRLRPGQCVAIDEAADAEFRVEGRGDDGTFVVCFDDVDVPALLNDAGHVPLPPYIQRPDVGSDRERYQTVYARTPGAVAAPTAGLHFTPAILDQARAKGVRVVTVTLHVGAGTFRPVKAARVEDHVMHEERFVLGEETADAISACRARGGRVIAVGTTAVRTLESCVVPGTRTVAPREGRTQLFLHPPHTPQVVDALLTNFHLPKSTLLMLVASFSSVERVLAAYELAVRERMRFFSYGDCMLLVQQAG